MAASSTSYARRSLLAQAAAEQPCPQLWLAVCILLGRWVGLPGGSSIWHTTLLVALPLWGIALEPLPRLLAGLERLQCTHLLATTLRQGPTHLQTLQRRWRSFWWLSRNKLRWQGPHAPHHLARHASHSGPVKVPHARLILHQQPLTPQACQHCTGANGLDYRRDRVPGTPSLSLITALCLT